MTVFTSSTQNIPKYDPMPNHIAVIMDGNGRWARARLLPRVAGHKAGVDALRELVASCRRKNIRFLTLFAFSTENWRRPQEEVSFLMQLFLNMLRREVVAMGEHGIRLRVIGQQSRFAPDVVDAIREAQELTRDNMGLNLTIAADYGGRWDILQAVTAAYKAGHQCITEDILASFLSTADLPEPDLLIRTGGEARISNFLMWQCAYTEFYFTDVFWPDFTPQFLDEAIYFYQTRERRFGRTSEQVKGV